MLGLLRAGMSPSPASALRGAVGSQLWGALADHMHRGVCGFVRDLSFLLKRGIILGLATAFPVALGGRNGPLVLQALLINLAREPQVGLS